MSDLERDLMSFKTETEFIEILLEALRYPMRRARLIRDFQHAVWNSTPRPGRESAWELLSDLAYDLEFFVADPESRTDDKTYYGHKRAEKEISDVLTRLQEMGYGTFSR